jgi:hypothetical protein
MNGAPYGMRSSMQKDLARAYLPEPDAITASIVRASDRQGIKVGFTKRLAECCRSPQPQYNHSPKVVTPRHAGGRTVTSGCPSLAHNKLSRSSAHQGFPSEQRQLPTIT